MVGKIVCIKQLPKCDLVVEQIAHDYHKELAAFVDRGGVARDRKALD